MNAPTTVKPELVVGIDGSAAALGALREGLRLAHALDYRVRVICAWSWPVGQGFLPGPPVSWDPKADAEKILADAMSGLEVPDGVTVTGETRYGDAADILIEASAGARMLITGSTGAGMARTLFLGSVSTKCAQRAACPVLVFRPMPEDAVLGSALTAESELLSA